MIVYGKNVYSQLKNDPAAIEKIYILKGLTDQRIWKSVKELNVPYEVCSKQTLDKLSKNETHQGIVCKVKEIPTYSVETLVAKAKKPGLLVALDGIQDPHNVGAILRTCDCAGVDGVILCKHNSAGLTPAAIKASTGAVYTVPVSIVTNMNQTLKSLKEQGYWIVGTDMVNARDYREGMYDVPTVLVIGNEGKGISPIVKKQCDYMVTLPMAGQIQSLNASVACGILLYEIFSQRNPL
ncbi:23S rRNA (guanosine(2251)-2'-O)-methyltransferase RlmB [Floccifex sp.]|uniref:23S rRNA (guanosine(2251)-2'-O)-methyltransferase RlmB n=1 Tax=Floccifex sp. TaxID=2815810 RepID=UPI002A751B90|nr:23S rRNA (guanosine(2251)-2'-O)-methyltransferase RlmB [Floccifex sp.]MDY2957548.1 23S rRNA (guanosine(2251)-2'-O)-methyltransferase RlmB [Floccifex sp.]